MSEKLKELLGQAEDWPEAAQEEAVAALEAIAGYVSLYEPPSDDR